MIFLTFRIYFIVLITLNSSLYSYAFITVNLHLRFYFLNNNFTVMYAFLAGESSTQRITAIIDDFCEII